MAYTRQDKNRQRILAIQEKKDRKERLRIAKEALKVHKESLRIQRRGY